MDKQSAIKLIRETFENPFKEEQFEIFIKNLFNKIEIEEGTFKNGYYGQFIPEAFKPHIKMYKRIGKYNDGNNRIDILIVYLEKEKLIERARTMQRNFVAGYLSGKYGSDTEKDAAIVAFVFPGLEDWRFSLVKMEYKLTQTKTGRPKGEEEFTPAKRFSFLVGKNEPNHTAKQQLIPFLQDDVNNPTLDQLEKAFSIEKVTKEFLNEYQKLYQKLKESIDGIVKKDKDVKEEFENKNINTIDFSKKLLGQIVFLYFLQKKGWLGVPKNKNWGEGDRNFLRSLFNKCVRGNKNFFNDYLEILFYNTLNDPRLNQVDQSYSNYFDCRIPFLNGGLFEPINNYDWKQTDIVISDALFSNNEKTEEGDDGSGILDVFDRFNFTVREDEPLEKEVALDPELLGKVFENLIEENLRKGQGAYYTPREIVHYMCQESLINYLSTELEGKVNKEDIEMLIKYGDIAIEYDKLVIVKKEENPEYNGKYKKIKMPENIKNNAGLIDDKLTNIRVCDPAVGSGAFPVGMMLEIVKARNVLTNYLVIANEVKQSSSNVIASETKQSRTPYNFKRHCIESCLYGVDIDSSAIDIAKLRFWLSLVVDEEDVTKIKPLPNLDYKLVCGNSLLGVERDLLNDHLFKQLEELKPKHFNETDTNKKLEFKKQIDKLIKQITNNDEHFDFEIYFSEVFHEKKGFDVVIANPPYLKERDNKSVFEIINNSDFGEKYHQGKMDYWYYFLHKAVDISKKEGVISYITSRYWLNSAGAGKLIQRVRDELSFVNFVDIGKLKVFDEVAGQHMVAVYSRGKNHDEFIYKKLENDISDIDKNIDTENMKIKFLLNKNIFSDHNEIILETDNLNLQEVISLGNITDISQGIVEATDKISQKQLEKSRRDVSAGDGVFVITESELHKLKINQSEKSIIKKYLDPNDVLKYRVAWNNKYLIYSDKKAKHFIKNDCSFTNIKKHLDNLKEFITSSNRPYGLHRPRELKYFSNPKIIFKGMFANNEFTYDEDGYFVGFSFSLIISKDENYSLKYILAILNSKFAVNWFYKYGKKRGAGVDIGVEKLRTFPIKKALPNEQKPFIDIVDKILAITKDEDYLNNPSKQEKVKDYERQIDHLVYKLYGLTGDEIKIVERFGKK